MLIMSAKIILLLDNLVSFYVGRIFGIIGSVLVK